jgi:hypothetical protein
MSAMKTVIAASALVGAADAFVASGAAPQHGAPVAMRGATQVAAQTDSTGSAAYPTLAVAAAGLTALGSFAGSTKTRNAKRATVACNFDKGSQIGAMDPVGFFDPLDFCKDEATFKDLRGKELKHGRLAMMGAVGMLVQSLVQLPGMEGVPKDVSAAWTGNGATGLLVTFGIIGALEAAVFVQDESKEPGNFGNPLPLVGNDYSDEMRSKELNNGRIAMFSAIGQIFAGLYTGKAGLEQFN